MPTVETTKLAWLRDPSAAQGQHALGIFECPCGAIIEDVEYTSAARYTCDGCGVAYDSCGWVQRSTAPTDEARLSLVPASVQRLLAIQSVNELKESYREARRLERAGEEGASDARQWVTLVLLTRLPRGEVVEFEREVEQGEEPTGSVMGAAEDFLAAAERFEGLARDLMRAEDDGMIARVAS